MNHPDTLRLMTEMHCSAFEDLEDTVNNREGLIHYFKGSAGYEIHFQAPLVSELMSSGISLEEFILPENCYRSLKDIQRVDDINILIERMCKHDIMKHQKEKILLGKVRKGNKKARNEILEHYYRCIINRAKNYAIVYSIDNEDCFQEGVIGFMQAVEKYDPRRDMKVITYGYYGINRRTNKFVRKNFKIVSVPQKTVKLLSDICSGLDGNDVRVLEKEMDAELRKHPIVADTVKELAYLNMGISQIDPSAVEEKFTSQHTPLKELEEKTRDEMITTLLNDEDSPLDERERKILQLHYGIDEDDNTLEDIGTELGITRERTRQIKEKALEKLRIYFNRKGITSIRDLGIGVE